MFGIFLMVESLRIPWFSDNFYSSPGFFPLILSICIMLLSIILFYKAIKIEGSLSIKFQKIVRDDRGIQRGILIIILIAAYIILLSVNVFYPIATILFLFVSIYLFHKKNIIKIIIISVTSTLALYLLFGKLFMIPLP